MGLDPVEILITLAIILLVFGGKRLRDLSRDLQGSIDTTEIDTTSPRATAFLIAGFFAVTLPTVLYRVHVVSMKQALIMLFVFLAWLLAAYFQFFEKEWE